MSERAKEETTEEEAPWVPRTKLGKMVQEGKMTSLDEIFQLGLKLREPEIVKTLVPDLKSEVVSVGIVQKQTDAGELTRFGAVVAVGNGNGFFGVGKGKAAQMKSAIDKATNDALLNVIPGPARVRQLGVQVRHASTRSPTGSWARRGASGSSSCPAPRSLGTVAGPALAQPPGARGRQGRLGQDVRLDRHALVSRERGLRRVLKVHED